MEGSVDQSLWDLLINRSGRFWTAFWEVVFCISDAQTRGVFKAALYSCGNGRHLSEFIHSMNSHLMDCIRQSQTRAKKQTG